MKTAEDVYQMLRDKGVVLPYDTRQRQIFCQEIESYAKYKIEQHTNSKICNECRNKVILLIEDKCEDCFNNEKY